MEINNNIDISAEELLSLLKQQIDFLESQMAERCGMNLSLSPQHILLEINLKY